MKNVIVNLTRYEACQLWFAAGQMQDDYALNPEQVGVTKREAAGYKRAMKKLHAARFKAEQSPKDNKL